MKKILWMVWVLLLSGCAALNPTGGKSNGEATADIPFLTYQRTGGFAGVNETWKIYFDGRLESGSGETKQLPAEVTESLLSQIQKADMGSLAKNSQTPDNCADCFTIQLTFHDEGKTTQLTVVPESSSADPKAVELVETIQEALNYTP